LVGSQLYLPGEFVPLLNELVFIHFSEVLGTDLKHYEELSSLLVVVEEEEKALIIL